MRLRPLGRLSGGTPAGSRCHAEVGGWARECRFAVTNRGQEAGERMLLA
ncbi:hypothetical protein [Paenibacillus mucilaginosus]